MRVQPRPDRTRIRTVQNTMLLTICPSQGSTTTYPSSRPIRPASRLRSRARGQVDLRVTVHLPSLPQGGKARERQDDADNDRENRRPGLIHLSEGHPDGEPQIDGRGKEPAAAHHEIPFALLHSGCFHGPQPRTI